MIELIIFFMCYVGFHYYYQIMIDAIEFTCINYDEFLEDSSKLYIHPMVEKYEDKYKSDLAKTDNEISLNKLHITERFDILLKQSIAEITDKINRDLVSYEWDLIKSTERNEQQQRAFFINDKMEQMKTELSRRILDKDSILELSESQLIQERLDNLKYSFVMEHTPIGNVIMYYNHTKEAFEYYSDNVVPYRYLDTVCRKYVIMNLCVPLYVDISKELKEFQSRKEEEPVKQMSNVFVKLKNYKKPVSKPTAKVILKARTNKYSYQGRMNNFSFMKQMEVKSESLSFADYKRMQINK
jgi:hypothetical protein